MARLQAFVQRLAAEIDYTSPLTLSVTLQRGLTIVFLSIVVALFILRRPVIGPHSPLPGALVALAGTFLPAIPVAATPREDDLTIMALSSALMLFGTSLSIASLLALGRCFGVLPEARGLVTRGPYARIRHPLYLSEAVSLLGLVVATASPFMGMVFALHCGLQYWRALNEEKALQDAFPEYEAYRQRTARFLPGIH